MLYSIYQLGTKCLYYVLEIVLLSGEEYFRIGITLECVLLYNNIMSKAVYWSLLGAVLTATPETPPLAKLTGGLV